VVLAVGTPTQAPALPGAPQSTLNWQWDTEPAPGASIRAARRATTGIQHPFRYSESVTAAVPPAGGALDQIYVQMTYPDANYDYSSLTGVLIDRVQETLDQLLPILKTEAASSWVYVTGVEVEGFVDPEEDFEEVVITQCVELSPEQAMDYWDRLGNKIQQWTKLLPEYLAQVATDRLSIRVAWKDG